MWYPMVATMILLIGKSVMATTDLTELLGILARDIVLKYLMDLPRSNNNECLGIITEDSSEILDYLLPLNITTYHVHLSRQEFIFSKRIDQEFEEHPWEKRIIAPLNEPCLGYVVQTSDIEWMVKSFARMYQNEKTVQRYNRTFLYLPVVTKLMTDAEFEAHIDETFHLKVMDFMPDLDIIKVVKEMYNDTRNVNTLKLDKNQAHSAYECHLCTNYEITDIKYNIFVSAERNHEGNSDTPLDDMNIEIITNRYVGLRSYERILLDVWNPITGFLYGANLYPYKITNLMGKQIVLVTIDYPPVTVIDWDADPSTYDGLEPQFIFEWSRRLNFTIGWEHDDTDFGRIYDNGSGTGMFGLLSMDVADISFNAFFLWEPEHHFLDYSTSHYRSTNTLICPKPSLLPGWRVITLPFNYGMWAAVLLSVVLCTAFLYWMSLASKKFLGNETQVSNMYSTWIECAFRTSGLLVLQVPPDERDWSTPRYVPMRHLVTWLILFYFVVTTAYCGGLATVLTVPRYEKPIETMADMARRDMKWSGMLEAYVNMIENTISPILTKVVNNFVWHEGDDLIEWLAEKAEKRQICVVVEQTLGGHFFLAPFINEETMNYMRLTKEEVYSCLTVYAMRKGTPLMPIMNSILRWARDAGLFFYWDDLTVRNYMSTRRQLSVLQSRNQYDQGPTKLQLHHIEGSFYLLAFGLVLGGIVFIFEVLIYNIREKNGKISTKK